MSDAVVLIVAAGFAAMGLAALARPASVLAQFGVEVETGDGRNEVSAVYGGFGLAVAALLAAVTFGNDDIREGVVIAVAIGLAGMAAGRLVAVARERPRGAYPVWTYFAIEVVLAIALWLAA